jgi:hypothetical protein
MVSGSDSLVQLWRLVKLPHRVFQKTTHLAGIFFRQNFTIDLQHFMPVFNFSLENVASGGFHNFAQSQARKSLLSGAFEIIPDITAAQIPFPRCAQDAHVLHD